MAIPSIAMNLILPSKLTEQAIQLSTKASREEAASARQPAAQIFQKPLTRALELSRAPAQVTSQSVGFENRRAVGTSLAAAKPMAI